MAIASSALGSSRFVWLYSEHDDTALEKNVFVSGGGVAVFDGHAAVFGGGIFAFEADVALGEDAAFETGATFGESVSAFERNVSVLGKAADTPRKHCAVKFGGSVSIAFGARGVLGNGYEIAPGGRGSSSERAMVTLHS